MIELDVHELNVLANLADELILDKNRKDELIQLFKEYTEKSFNFENATCEGYFYYILGNCSSEIYQYHGEDWYSRYLINTVNLYQNAVYCLKKEKRAVSLLSCTLTNLGNFLSSQGRCFCAQYYWDQAIEIDRNTVAIVAKARDILFRAEQLYDDSHTFIHYFFANKLITEGYENIDLLDVEQKIPLQKDGRLHTFQQWYQKNFKNDDFNYLRNYKQKTKTKQESLYLHWVAQNKLFINDLNDLLSEEIVFQDILGLPSMTRKINSALSLKEDLVFHSNFDELRNEFTYARFLVFQVSKIKEESKHFYNKTYQHVYDKLHAIDNLKTSHMKSAFRILYSIFDKISYFIAKYFNLEIDDRKVSFQKIFGEYKYGEFKPNKIFQNSKNYFIHALFYILKEIEGNSPSLDLYSNPKTYKLAKIRNHLEHRSFRIIDDFGYELNTKYNSCEVLRHQALLRKQDELEENNLQSSAEYMEVIEKIKEKKIKSKYILEMPISEFEQSLMDLLRIVRNSLMYLSLAVHYEEKEKPIDGELIITKAVPIK
ncbi:LA2681 family HEPN domain-containing protein [Acinetobacter bouvetii]|uniref:LA2681-like HEPN domain-containing protein n=1 Tax=Acinetobacter bouvetii TaxID=202951 RepID=A0A811G7V8_9GAMM|nr:LA2681 family HEPN domain-containing protein [Acinetobacter bouvetii]CAB1211848.1 hypothetical protein SFB21_0957 [Acinetobacter bouvetii]